MTMKNKARVGVYLTSIYTIHKMELPKVATCDLLKKLHIFIIPHKSI